MARALIGCVLGVLVGLAVAYLVFDKEGYRWDTRVFFMVYIGVNVGVIGAFVGGVGAIVAAIRKLEQSNPIGHGQTMAVKTDETSK